MGYLFIPTVGLYPLNIEDPAQPPPDDPEPPESASTPLHSEKKTLIDQHIFRSGTSTVQNKFGNAFLAYVGRSSDQRLLLFCVPENDERLTQVGFLRSVSH